MTFVETKRNRETAEVIYAATEHFGADIICIGSHTRPGFTAKVAGVRLLVVWRRESAGVPKVFAAGLWIVAAYLLARNLPGLLHS